MPSPYSQICGTNMISSAATVTALPSHVGLANAVPYRGAASSAAAAAGVKMITVQVNSADVVCTTSARR